MNRQHHKWKDTLNVCNYLPVKASIIINHVSDWQAYTDQPYSWCHTAVLQFGYFIFKFEWKDLRPWRH